MSDSSIASLTSLFEEFRADVRGSRDALLVALQVNLRRLVTSLLRKYPIVERRRQEDSLVQDLNVKLLQALDAGVRPPTAVEFIKFASFRFRQMLRDLAVRYRNEALARNGRFDLGRFVGPGDSSVMGVPEPPDPAADDASVLLEWIEFHDRVHALAEELRTVFEMHYYFALTQAEIAELLDLTPKQVSRIWLEAAWKLRKYIPKFGPPDDAGG